MLAKVFAFVSGIITGVLTTCIVIGTSLGMFPERWQKLGNAFESIKNE